MTFWRYLIIDTIIVPGEDPQSSCMPKYLCTFPLAIFVFGLYNLASSSASVVTAFFVDVRYLQVIHVPTNRDGLRSEERHG